MTKKEAELLRLFRVTLRVDVACAATNAEAAEGWVRKNIDAVLRNEAYSMDVRCACELDHPSEFAGSLAYGTPRETTVEQVLSARDGTP